MEGIGIALNGVGALLIAYSQFEMNRTISMWLRTLDLTVDQILTRRQPIVRVSDIDEHWDRDLKRDKWMAPIGWLLFVSGFLILLYEIAIRVPHA